MINWSEEKIREKANEFIKLAAKEMRYDESKLSLDKVNIVISARMSRSLGLCKSEIRYGKCRTTEITISKRMIQLYEDELIIDVIGHEVAHHIADTIRGKSQGHNDFFKRICNQLGVQGKSSSDCSGFLKENYEEIINQINESKNIKYKKPLPIRYVIECRSCGAKSYQKTARKNSIEHWLLDFKCRPCSGRYFNIYDLKENVKYWNNGYDIYKERIDKNKLKELISCVKEKENE